MKIINKITNFVYSITHTKQLQAENDALKQSYQRLSAINDKLQKELASANNQVAYAEKQAAEAEKNYDRINNFASQLSDEINQLRYDARKYRSAYKALCEQGIDPVRAKAIYEAVAPVVDEDGSEIFAAAQQILGTFSYSHFAYEDNCGYFEADDTYLLPYLLVQYAYLLGDANADKDRWEIACPGYEKCVDLSIDETTPEYQEFEKKLYVKVLENLHLLAPAETQAKEVEA